MIERIRIQNYRSLHDVDVRLEPLTVLIGRSGSGKSNFVRAIRLLRDALSGKSRDQTSQNQPFDYAGANLSYELDLAIKGVDRLNYAIVFSSRNPGFIEEERLVAGTRTIFHRNVANGWIVEPTVEPKPNAGQIVLGTLTGVREATIAYVALTRGIGCYDFPGGVLQEHSPLELGPGYQGSGDTYLAIAGRILEAIEKLDDWNAIGKSLTAVNPRLSALDLLLPSRNQLRVGYSVAPDRTRMVDVAQESEGFRRYLAYLLALYQIPPKQMMLFEHPEHGIHPGALSALFEEFKAHVEDGRGQVILTTHSPQFLDHFSADHLRVVAIENGITSIGPLAEDQAEALQKRLLNAGELLTVEDARIATPEEAGV